MYLRERGKWIKQSQEVCHVLKVKAKHIPQTGVFIKNLFNLGLLCSFKFLFLYSTCFSCLSIVKSKVLCFSVLKLEHSHTKILVFFCKRYRCATSYRPEMEKQCRTPQSIRRTWLLLQNLLKLLPFVLHGLLHEMRPNASDGKVRHVHFH